MKKLILLTFIIIHSLSWGEIIKISFQNKRTSGKIVISTSNGFPITVIKITPENPVATIDTQQIAAPGFDITIFANLDDAHPEFADDVGIIGFDENKAFKITKLKKASLNNFDVQIGEVINPATGLIFLDTTIGCSHF